MVVPSGQQVHTPPRPVAVLVQEPRIAASPPDERSPFAAFALREAIVRTLAGLEGIEAIGPDELPAGVLSVPDAARAVAAAHDPGWSESMSELPATSGRCGSAPSL